MISNQSGAIAILTAIMLTMFIGFVALSIDTGKIVVTKNELQNAADAGALAGARELYDSSGSAVQISSNQTALDAAIKNLSANSPVEVNWTAGGNIGTDIERGHWSFGRGSVLSRGFYPDDSLSPTTIFGVSDADLDDTNSFINAVRVTTRREATPVATFFAGIFGITSFQKTATAVGYLGFAGSFLENELALPIAICFESLSNGCNIGRMINSGGDVGTSNTGGWTDFDQSEDCNGVNANDLIDVMTCDSFSGNQDIVKAGMLETGGGQTNSVYAVLTACWILKTGQTEPWAMTLPVVKCPGNNVGNCSELVGAVNVEIVWISGTGEDPQFNDVPTVMGDWPTAEDVIDINNDPNNDGIIDGKDYWASFVEYFKLQNVDGSDAPYDKKSIYFKPTCDIAEPAGGTGGENLGVMARVPVLVD